MAMANPFDCSGRVAFITGGAGGFGMTFARALAGAGADVALVGRRLDAVTTAAVELSRDTGRKVIGLSADVASEAQVKAAIDATIAQLGKIDILINNAGVNVRKPTTDYSLDEWRSVVDTSLTGAFLCSKHALPGMIERTWGRVIHVASMLGVVGLADRPAYTAAKGGMIQLARTQALEVAKFGVNVNALAPGPFMTDINKPVVNNPGAYRYFLDRLPVGRFGDPDELSGAILFLASNASSFMTGNVLTIDGGWTAQ
jgi:NAD(P)-dependent dehydrogenase (short-subunit alcohol dehydrogenase family)